jgi:hypothetical protein
MVESIIRSGQVREAVRSSCLGPYIDGFVDAAATVGYTLSSFRDLVVGTSQFARFLTASGITDVRQLRDHHVRSFIGALPVCQRKKGYSMPAGRGSCAARSALRYLRAIANSVALYRRNVEPFLQELREDAMPDRFAALSPMRARVSASSGSAIHSLAKNSGKRPRSI